MNAVLTAYRITSAKFTQTAFSGQGGLYAAGRWHEQGTPVVYGALTSSLALLEWRVHTNHVPVERAYVLITFTVPEALVQFLDETALPSDWRQMPPPRSTQRLGMDFLEADKHLALAVPSVINPLERNLVINPHHADMGQLQQKAVTALQVDQRLF